MPTKTKPVVLMLGNDNPQEHGRPADHLDCSVTRVELWDGVTDEDFVALALSTKNDRRLIGTAAQLKAAERRRFAVAVHEVAELWEVHSPSVAPAWVDGADPALVKAVAAFFGCAAGEPKALLTNGGRDLLHAALLTTATQPAAANYIALTANATAPAATDTVLTGEIATGGGGLVRAQATYAHTAGTTTSTLTRTFAANGSDVLPVTVAKIGVFNASSGGTLTFETLLAATATLSAVGDSVTPTDTVTAS